MQALAAADPSAATVRGAVAVQVDDLGVADPVEHLIFLEVLEELLVEPVAAEQAIPEPAASV